MFISPPQKKIMVPLAAVLVLLLIVATGVYAQSAGWLNRMPVSESANIPAQPQVSPIVQEVIMASPIVVGSPNPAKVEGMARLTGEVICLPKKNTNGPQTMECAYGLQTANGNYGLKDTDPTYANISSVEMGVEVRVIGRVQPKTAEDTYDSVGVIEVVKIEKL